MYTINFNEPIHIYFIGIGGISMSGFAELLHSMNFTISGSDRAESKITEHLTSLGIHVYYEQAASNITSDIDLVVYTAAISKDNPEYQAAVHAGIPMMDRAEMVGQVMKNYKNSIAIAGTHGKTTTTSMLSHILLEGNLDPTISVGGILKAINGNLRIGKSENFLTEACEYTNSFLKFHPTIEVILNIEEDHMDFFKDINDIYNSFESFVKLLPHEGLLVLNRDIEIFDKLYSLHNGEIYSYSTSEPDSTFYADNISYNENGSGEFDLYYNGTFTGHIALSVPGLHNISNALGAIAVAYYFHIPLEQIQTALESFYGTDRRFQYKGKIGEITIIDDYAHHPTEITATLTAAQNYPCDTTWCVFQPHTYTRTKAFLHEFAEALAHADKIVLADIYAAREKDPGDISSKDILNLLLDMGKDAYYFSSFDEIENFLLENCVNNDLVITMGAGNVVNIGESLLGM